MDQRQIVNREELHAVLERVLGRFKTHREAAKAVRLTQATFTRLLNGTGPEGSRRRMRHRVYVRLRGGIESNFRGSERAELLGQFRRGLITQQGEQVRVHYLAWQRSEYERLQPKCSKVLLALWKHPVYRPELEIFLRRTTGVKDNPKWRWSNLRLLLALYRAVEPLAAAKATWGVERSWEELHDTKKLRSFLRASFKREILLWRRGGYLARMNELRPQRETRPVEEPDIPIPDDLEQASLEEVSEAFANNLIPLPTPWRGSRAQGKAPRADPYAPAPY